MLRPFLVIILLLLAAGCGRSTDDATAWATVWHAGEALERGAQPKPIGKALKTMAERHAQQHDYKIDISGDAK